MEGSPSIVLGTALHRTDQSEISRALTPESSPDCDRTSILSQDEESLFTTTTELAPGHHRAGAPEGGKYNGTRQLLQRDGNKNTPGNRNLSNEVPCYQYSGAPSLAYPKAWPYVPPSQPPTPIQSFSRLCFCESSDLVRNETLSRHFEKHAATRCSCHIPEALQERNVLEVCDSSKRQRSSMRDVYSLASVLQNYSTTRPSQLLPIIHQTKQSNVSEREMGNIFKKSAFTDVAHCYSNATSTANACAQVSSLRSCGGFLIPSLLPSPKKRLTTWRHLPHPLQDYFSLKGRESSGPWML